ncbi:MAG: DNA polymerase III subunit [Patescibacteria group bacterium]
MNHPIVTEPKIIGHEKIVKFLENSIKNGRMSHAYLFYGAPNLGKRFVAEYFAAKLLGENIPTRQITEHLYPDLFWVERLESKKNISIDQMRELKGKLSSSSFNNSYKVAIINEAENLNQAAANSFLKILEEPSPRSVIILLVNDLKNIPATIISRSQLIRFNQVKTKTIENYLINNLKIKKDLATRMALLSFGRPGIAVRLAGDKLFLKKYEDTADKFLKIIAADLVGRLNFVADLDLNDIPFSVWESVARDILMAQLDLPVIEQSRLLKIKSLAKEIPLDKLVDFLEELRLTRIYLSYSANKRIVLDNLFVSLG